MSRPVGLERSWRDRLTTIALGSSIAMALSICGCGKSTDETIEPVGEPAASTASPTQPISEPTLRMVIDGEPWVADHVIEGMVNPPGYDRAVLISGSHGPSDKNEQAFTLMLLDVAGKGKFHVKSGSGNASVVQMGNLSAARYLAGGVLGYDVQLELMRVSTTPVLIEARFSGTLNANDSTAIVISDGYFFYSE